MEDFQLMLIKVNQRVQKATEVQSLLTEYGCLIKMRLGLHEAGDQCSNQGLIILQLTGGQDERQEFERRLGEIKGVTFKVTGI